MSYRHSTYATYGQGDIFKKLRKLKIGKGLKKLSGTIARVASPFLESVPIVGTAYKTAQQIVGGGRPANWATNTWGTPGAMLTGGGVSTVPSHSSSASSASSSYSMSAAGPARGTRLYHVVDKQGVAWTYDNPSAAAAKRRELKASGNLMHGSRKRRRRGHHGRRLNALNPHALNRSLRRLRSFEAYAKRVLHITTGHAVHVRPRAHRRKAA